MTGPRVIVAVHGRFHAFSLAEGLRRRGMLAQLITTYPAFAVRRFVGPGGERTTFPWLEAWRRLGGRLPILPPFEPGLSRRFGRAAAGRLSAAANLLVGWSGASLEAIAAARARGLPVALERGSTHIDHQNETLRAEYARLGLPRAPVAAELIAREREEYARADRIFVPTAYAAETFRRGGIAAERLVVNPYGVDAAAFAPPPAARADGNGRPVILFAGLVGPRKGVPTLLRAFAPLRGRADLWIAGPREPGMDAVLAGLPTEGVRFLGPLARPALAAAYHRARVFCLPSIEEGFGMVLLEAMAAGLPIVASDVSGGRELADGGRSGLAVPAGDPVELRAALERLLDEPEVARAMGDHGRVLVAERYTWDRYVERAVAAYREMLAS